MTAKTFNVVYANPQVWLASIIGLALETKLPALNKSFGERACDGIGGVAAKAVLAEIEAQGAEIVFPGEVPSWLAEVRHIRTRGTE